MGKFIQDGTGVVVSVDDSKDDRFEIGYTPYKDEKPKPKTSGK